MEYKENSQNIHKFAPKKPIQAGNGLGKRAFELQNIDKKSNACSLSQHIENNKIDVILPQIVQQKAGELELSVLWKYLFLVIISSQFSILSAIILIQYFSSKIQIAPLLLLFLFSALLHPLFTAAAFNIQNAAHFSCSSVDEEQADVGHTKGDSGGTVLKINSQVCKRDIAKTKKVQFPNISIIEQECTQQTIKKVEGQSINQSEKHKIISFRTRKCLFIGSRVVLTVFNLSIATTNIYFCEANSYHNNAIALSLSILSYVLSIGSSIPTYLFLDKLERFIQQKKGRKAQEKQERFDQVAPKTKVSIDKFVQPQPEKRSCSSIQRQIKLIKYQGKEVQNDPIQKSNQNNKSDVEKQSENICKQLTKKSVLKNKLKKPSLDNIGLQATQRRRVQINSKKIQYFQYAQISPSHSIIEQQPNSNAITNKYKSYLHRISIKEKKAQIEQMILKKKILSRQKIVKSSVCLSGRREEEGYRADYFC